MAKKDPRSVTTMRLPEALLRAADDRARETQRSRTGYLIELIKADVKKARRQKPEDPDADVFG